MRSKNMKIALSRSLIITLVSLVLGGSLQVAPANAAPPTFGTWPAISASWSSDFVSLTPPTSNSTGAWTYTSSNSGIAVVVGSTLILRGVGTSVITATQAATASFDLGTVTTTLTVTTGTPTLGTFAAISVPVDSRTYVLTPPATNSCGQIWTYASTNPAVATITGNIATLVNVGSTTITATQAACSPWASATASTTLTVTGGAPTIGPFADITVTRGSVTSIVLTPPTSNSAGSWSYTSSNSLVAVIAGSLVTPVGLGTTTITAVQAAAGIYGSATKTMTLTVQGAPPTVGLFTSQTMQLKPFDANELVITPPTSNSLGTWSYVSSDEKIAKVTGNVVKALKTGSVTITGTQAASTTFGASAAVSMTLTITGASPALGEWTALNKTVNDSEFTIVPPSSPSAGKWTFTSSNPAVVELTGTTAKIKGAGQVIITGKQASDWNWLEATATLNITVAGTSPTVGTLSALEAGVGDSPITLTSPSSNSIGAWAWISSNPAVATITAGVMTVVGVGTATISATQSPAGNFAASSTLTTILTVKPRPVAGEFTAVTVKFAAAAPVITPPTSTSTGAWSYTSAQPTVVNFTNGIMQIIGAGVATITAKQASTATLAQIARTFTVTVQPIAPTITIPDPLVLTFSDAPQSIKGLISNSEGAYSYTFDNATVASASNGMITTLKASQSLVTISQVAAGNYSYGVVATNLVVKPYVKVAAAGRTINVTVKGASAKVYVNGKLGKIGKNTGKVGNNTIRIISGGVDVYNRVIRLK